MPTILLVDDNKGDLILLQDAIRAEIPAAETRLAQSGPEALASLDGIDLVLLDLGMPGMDGMETLRHLRAAEPDLPVMIVTGNDDSDAADEAFAQQAQGVLVKPCSIPGYRLAARQVHDFMATAARQPPTPSITLEGN